MAVASTPTIGRNAAKARAGERVIDRDREFRLARRHSRRVRVLRIVLPLMAMGILSLYALPSFLRVSVDKGRGTATVRAIELEKGALKMIEPHVRGVSEKNESYDFTADSATQASVKADEMYLVNVRGRMTGLDGKLTTLTAPDGTYNSKSEQITFSNGVAIKREPGLAAGFQTATASLKEQSAVSNTPVVVRLHESTIHADGVTLYWGESRAIFEGNVRTHVVRQEPAAAEVRPERSRQPEPDGNDAWSAAPAIGLPEGATNGMASEGGLNR
ncbi:LPS export ABC transporter periplasmic protein LptC [Rhodomicrobium sp. Az07]|uniref:LPS export ABC transporter periplasmic protein LptC n=1 Tax=Rhodomicrobium sp. Az07 TaxID=2839034 RepID=UPI001BEA17EB|nr:LPS export ABC transporter periplasmic protein LptC [Rhodomicrobium sp. Az07]MBT3069966.1 LPS export ABC transporter periplasmic protein LptC [Rhodomicrobium sp. Az07]